MFYIAQITAIFITIYLARHDATSTNHFSDHGQPEALGQFHSNNFRLRLSLCVGLSLMVLLQDWTLHWSDLWDGFYVGIANGGWAAGLFDPVLNRTRKRGFSWDYLGEWNDTDVWWKKHFGKQAGQIKALFFSSWVVVANALYLIL